MGVMSQLTALITLPSVGCSATKWKKDTWK